MALIGSGARRGGPRRLQAAAKPGQSQPRSKANSIQGSVTVDGLSLPDIQVIVSAAGKGNTGGIQVEGNSRTTSTDETGHFALENLSLGPYRLFPISRGYIASSGIVDDEGKRILYYPGDTPILRMVKGGVITGRVIDLGGVPMVQVPVRAMRLKDTQGRPASSANPPLLRGGSSDQTTDDRGVYRIYGLEPGTYVVSAGGGNSSFNHGPYDGDGPTYYPSSTRSSATEILLAQGQEIGGIDITYQSFKGHSVAGTVTGAIPPGSLMNAAIVVLSQAGAGTLQGIALAFEMDGTRAFTVNGVPDGKYNIAAIGGIGAKEISLAPPRPIAINGDMSGVNLTLTPISHISGTATVDVLAPDPKLQCRPGKGLAYCLMRGTSNASEDEVFASLEGGGISFEREAVPDEKGKFQLQLLGGPGRYHLDVILPDEELYIKSITIPPDVPGRVPLDASAGFAVAAGQSNNLSVVLGEGAAGLTGILVRSGPDPDNSGQLGVAVVPAEPGSEDDVLRYAQTTVRADGAFQLHNLSPGKYYLIARRIPDSELGTQDLQRPWWNREFRKKLYAEAEKNGKSIEFRPCQRVVDFVIQYTAPAPSSKKANEKQV